jgi:hypothetical protein
MVSHGDGGGGDGDDDAGWGTLQTLPPEFSRNPLTRVNCEQMGETDEGVRILPIGN